MPSLILKDLLLEKKAALFAVGYSTFLFIIFPINQAFGEYIYIMGSIAIAYIFIMGTSAHDDKSKSEIIFNSLPIKRKYIVLAKYLAVCLFIVIGLALTGLIGTIIKGTGLPLSVRYINYRDIVSVFFSVGLIVSIYYPFYFKFGYTSMRMVNVILFLLAFFAPQTITEYIEKNQNEPLVQNLITGLINMPDWLTSSFLILTALVIMVISLATSVIIYNNKEF